MAIRISQLPLATTVDGDELFVIVQDGVTKRIAVNDTFLQGPPGAAGTGYVFRGNWNSASAYVVNDVVVYNGSSYVSKTNANTNKIPGDTAFWGIVALKGDTGAAGATGATGAQGAQGAQGIQGPPGSLDLNAEIINNEPAVRPTIDIPFEHQGILDSRVTLTRNCEATYFDEFGVLKIAATNEPVFDRDPETGESKGLYIAGPSTELLPANLKTSFGNWALQVSNPTISLNSQIAPDGTLTAARLIDGTTTASTHGINTTSVIPVTDGKDYTFSVFAKKGVGETAPDIIQLSFSVGDFAGGSNIVGANFDIANGKITRITSTVRAQIVKLPNNWYRISITAKANVSNNSTFGAYILFNNNNPLEIGFPIYTGSTTSDVIIWGPQLEESPKLTPYKYTNNAIAYSQAVQAWTLTNVTTLVNSGYAPDGTFTAERVAETAINAGHTAARNSILTTVSGQVYTSAVYLKKGIGITAPDNILIVNTHNRANFNIATGGVNAIQFPSTASASVENVGNGWFKCILSWVATTTASSFSVVLVNNDSFTVSGPSYAGQETSDVFVWGAHVVQGATLPEYIRNPEIATINTTNKLPLQEGSLVVKAEVTQEQTALNTRSNESNTLQSSHYLFDNKSANNRLSLYARKPNNLINRPYGIASKNMFDQSDDATAVNSLVYIVQKDKGINGFDVSYQIPSGAIGGRDYQKAFGTEREPTISSGDIVTYSFHVQMDDGGIPVIATSDTDASGDFRILFQNSFSTAGATYSVTPVSGTVYRISMTRASTTSSPSRIYGINKANGNSSRGFKITGNQLEFGTLSSYQRNPGPATWNVVNTVIKPNQVPGPFGVDLADRLIETSASGIHSTSVEFLPKERHNYLYSVYLKKGIGVSAPNVVKLTTSTASNGSFSNSVWADFNLASGIVANSTGCTASIEDVSNGWYRCSMLFPSVQKAANALEADNFLQLMLTNNVTGGQPSGSIYTGSVDRDVFVWGPQLQEYEITASDDIFLPLSSSLVGTNSTATLTRASSATIDGLDFGLNAPRYTQGGVLIEEGTTNLLLNTDGVLTTYIATTQVSAAVTQLANFTNSVQFGDSSVQRVLYKTANIVSGAIYTFSCYVQMDDDTAPRPGYISANEDFAFILDGGIYVPSVNLVSGSLYRLSRSLLQATPNSQAFYGIIKYVGQSSKTFRVAGFQLEQKPYSTSYAESGATAFVRSPDSLSIPASGVTHSGWTTRLNVRRTTTGLPLLSNTLCEAVIDSNNFYRLSLDINGRLLGAIRSNSRDYAVTTSRTLSPNVNHTVAWTVDGSTSQLIVDNTVVATWTYAPPVGSFPANFTIPGGVSAVYNNFSVEKRPSVILPFESGHAPIYTAEITDVSGVINRAEYQTLLPEGSHKLALSYGPNYKLGDSANLFRPGEALSDYNDTSNVTQATAAITGFGGSIQFGNNTVTRYALKNTSLIYGIEYLFSAFVQMDDGTAPIWGPVGGGSFRLMFTPSTYPITSTSQVTSTLVSGTLYKISASVIAGITTSATAVGLFKTTTEDSKTFKVSGMSITRKTTVLDTFNLNGPELLPAGELLADYAVRTNVAQASVPIIGFSNSIYVGDNSSYRAVGKSVAIVAGSRYRFSFYIQMDDGSVPIFTSGVNQNLNIVLGSSPVNFQFITIQNFSGNIFIITAETTASQSSSSNYIEKSTTFANIGFRIAGMSLRQVQTSQNNNLKLFMDGNKVSEKVAPFTLTSLSNTSYLGSDVFSNNQWDGCIARISAYPRQLSDTVIQTITEQ